MNMSQITVAVSITALAILALLFFTTERVQKGKRLSPTASLAFGFILAGIVFGDDRIIGYSLMGIGVILSVYDVYRKLRSR
jgi:hypothetical protein